MPPPKVSYCLVCEDVRQETGNKLTILGYYGIMPGDSPGVHIFLSKLGNGIDLMFLCGMSRGSGMAQARVLQPDGSPIAEGGPLPIPSLQGAEGLVFGFG